MPKGGCSKTPQQEEFSLSNDMVEKQTGKKDKDKVSLTKTPKLDRSDGGKEVRERATKRKLPFTVGANGEQKDSDTDASAFYWGVRLSCRKWTLNADSFTQRSLRNICPWQSYSPGKRPHPSQTAAVKNAARVCSRTDELRRRKGFSRKPSDGLGRGGILASWVAIYQEGLIKCAPTSQRPEVNMHKNIGIVEIQGAVTSPCFPKDDAGGLARLM